MDLFEFSPLNCAGPAVRVQMMFSNEKSPFCKNRKDNATVSEKVCSF